MTLQMEPQSEDIRVKVTYNDETVLFDQVLEAGKKLNVTIETPKVTGVAKTYFVIDGEDVPVAQAHYTFDEQSGEGADGAQDTDGK